MRHPGIAGHSSGHCVGHFSMISQILYKAGVAHHSPKPRKESSEKQVRGGTLLALAATPRLVGRSVVPEFSRSYQGIWSAPNVDVVSYLGGALMGVSTSGGQRFRCFSLSGEIFAKTSGANFGPTSSQSQSFSYQHVSPGLGAAAPRPGDAC